MSSAGPATWRSRRRGSSRTSRALPPELALGPVAAQTTRFFATRRASAAATATAALDSDRYLALLDAVDALLADPPLTDDAARPAVEILPELIGEAVRRARKHLRPPTPTRRGTSATWSCTRSARPASGCATPPR